MIDLNPNHLATVERILTEHVPECEVRAFGSRATWTAKDYSDLDLAVVGKGPLDWKTLGRLREAFEESDLPIRVDVLDWHAISESFRDVIEREYVSLSEGTGEPAAASKWREVTLGDLIDIKHGFAFKGTSIHDEPQGDVLLTPGNFAIGGGFKGDRFKYYDGMVPEEFVLDEGDLLVTMTDLSKQSDTLGYPALVPSSTDGRRYLHNQRLGKILPRDNEEFCPRYLYYLMCTDDYRHEVLASATGTTVKHTSPDRIRQYSFALPTLDDQRTIAHVLGTLDDKIELNRRVNETLEDMARALFKSWFVDFDPVRAKMEGRWRRGESLPGLPVDLYDLFPDRLVLSELGQIPEGWRVGVLDDAIKLLSGGTPRTSVAEYWDGDVPWYTPKDAPSLTDVFVLETERSITQAGIENSAARVLPVGTTIITARGTVGRLACLGVPMAMNQTCYGIRGASGYPDFFTYWIVRTTVADLQQRTHGTIFDTITRQTFKLVETVLPPVEQAERFEAIVKTSMGRILSNLRESNSLATQRDALLPKLISGESRSNDHLENWSV